MPNTTLIDELAGHARALDAERMAELVAKAQRVANDVRLAPLELDPEYLILPLLKEILGLTLADKRRLNAALTKVIAREAQGMHLGGAL